MKEIQADLWTIPADCRVITTNGFIKKDGRLVMGRGCAKEARDKFPGLDLGLGHLIRKVGNIPVCVETQEFVLATLPVKHNWWERADPDLIVNSIEQLIALTEMYAWKQVVLPRPGCGNGQLDWGDVKALLVNLDDRFTVCHKEEYANPNS